MRLFKFVEAQEATMFDKIKKWLSPEPSPEPEQELPLEPEVEPEPEPLPPPPDVIEVPWKFAAAPKNFQDAINKIHAELKEFLYESRLKEVNALKTVDKFVELQAQKIEQLKEAYGIPSDMEYDFILPEGTGRPGYLKKKESK